MGTKKMNVEFYNLKATGDLHKNIFFGMVGNDVGVHQRMGREAGETGKSFARKENRKTGRKKVNEFHRHSTWTTKSR